MKQTAGRKLPGGEKGFTLLELLVVMVIMALFSSMVISYSHSARQQISLYSEKSRLVQAIYRAKSFSMGLYAQSVSLSCGYGIHFDYAGKKYSIFRYDKGAVSDCRTIAAINPASEQTMSTFNVDGNLNMSPGAPRLDDVLFLPPDPIIIVNSGGTTITSGPALVVLGTADGTLSSQISVNSAGLINF